MLICSSIWVFALSSMVVVPNCGCCNGQTAWLAMEEGMTKKLVKGGNGFVHEGGGSCDNYSWNIICGIVGRLVIKLSLC